MSLGAILTSLAQALSPECAFFCFYRLVFLLHVFFLPLILHFRSGFGRGLPILVGFIIPRSLRTCRLWVRLGLFLLILLYHWRILPFLNIPGCWSILAVFGFWMCSSPLVLRWRNFPVWIFSFYSFGRVPIFSIIFRIWIGPTFGSIFPFITSLFTCFWSFDLISSIHRLIVHAFEILCKCLVWVVSSRSFPFQKLI